MTQPRSFRVPYRICLLGEHVDHQGGETLSANVAIGVRIDATPRADDRVTVTAADFGGEVATIASGPVEPANGNWGDYARGIVASLRRRGLAARGMDAVVRGEFPSGGLSSSAAVQIAYALALLEINRKSIDRDELAHLVVEAEREYVGVKVGYLDPMTILFAEGERLLHLEYRNFTKTLCPWPHGRPLPELVLVFSGVVRRLLDSPYNTRIAECREAARRLDPEAQVFSEVRPERRDLLALPPISRRRAEHYFGEIDRVHRGIAAWRSGDIAAFARLIDACGDSCVENFELGTPEIVDLVTILRETPGVLAARFTGGGFGGSVLALCRPGTTDAIRGAVLGPYARKHPECAARARVAAPGFGPAAGDGLGVLI